MLKKDPALLPVPASAMTIRLSPIAGVVMGVFLAAGLLSCLWAMFVTHSVQWLPKEVTWRGARQGELTQHLSQQLDHVSLAREAAKWERAASWLLIGDTGSRVRQGCPGWLFLADENRIQPDAQANAEARAHKVAAVAERLAARGIKLIVAVVPDKSRIAAEQLCNVLRPAQLATRVTDWQAVLAPRGVTVLDLAQVLQPLGARSYLRSDTHWSEQGAEAAANAIAQQVFSSGVQPTPTQQSERRTLATIRRAGDLIRLAGLEGLPEALQPEADVLQPSQFMLKQAPATVSDDDLFGDSQLPNIALIGTSFSRNANFVAFLEQALAASIGNFAKDGGAFAGAAKDYLDSPAFKQTPPQLLIWEIPERDIQTPYHDELPLNF